MRDSDRSRARVAPQFSQRHPMRVAVAESNPSQAHALGTWLSEAGHRCCHFHHGEALIRAHHHSRFDALVLEWNARNPGDVEVLKQIRRSRHGAVPVLLVGAHHDENAVVSALRQGADDYVTKPVRPSELVARLHAIHRRSELRTEKPPTLQVDGFQIDLHSRILHRDSRSVRLTAKDFDLSVLFLSNIGRLLSRDHIRERVWGQTAAVSSRSLDTHVSRVRAKLGLTPDQGWRLAAVYRYGYRLGRLGASEIASSSADRAEPQTC